MKRKNQPKTKATPADGAVAKNGGKPEVELKEEDLNKVSGGLIGLLDKNH
jgi:hypothetical protein